MTPAQWQRVRTLFEQALEAEPVEVGLWLDREAGDDGAVRAEVASLLEHHTRVGAFLAEPIGDRMPDLLVEERALSPGQTVGPYEIVREVGRGGMGRVYLATDTRLGRTVALKALLPHVTSDPSQRERLRREARAAAALTHPGICTIYALEEFEDELFIAAEYVDGETLRQEIARGRRPSPPVALQAARDLAAALASAHAKGITHRDLKPENVMRTADGRLKILDFGLARFEPAAGPPAATTPGSGRLEERMTRPGALLGTPGYMAPEQLNGQPGDARADVFAFGVLMYEYASGAHPFEAATPLAVAARVLEGEVRPIETWSPDMAPQLAAAIRRCLRKAPGERFASAAEIVEAVARDAEPAPRAQVTRWWRAHHVIVVALYFLASALAWQIKEWHQGSNTWIFVAIGVAAAVGGVFRGHLLFTERMNGGGLTDEQRRAAPATLVVDLAIALALFADGLILSAVRPLAGVLTIALAVGIALARVVVEPSTTAAAFRSSGARES